MKHDKDKKKWSFNTPPPGRSPSDDQPKPPPPAKPDPPPKKEWHSVEPPVSHEADEPHDVPAASETGDEVGPQRPQKDRTPPPKKEWHAVEPPVSREADESPDVPAARKGMHEYRPHRPHEGRTPPPKKEWHAAEPPVSRKADESHDVLANGGTGHEYQAYRPQESYTPPPSVMPVYSDEPEPHVGLAVQEPNRLWWLPLLGFTGVVGVILIVAAYVLQQPLTNLTDAQKATKETAMIEARQRAEYQALDGDVRGNMGQVQRRQINLDVEAQKLANEAELHLGQPVQRIAANPSERPRELDLAILESRDMASKWAGLVNAVCRPPQSNPFYATIQDVNSRVRDGKLVAADRYVAAGLLALTAQQETQAAERAEQVRGFTASLDARRFEMALTSMEGSK